MSACQHTVAQSSEANFVELLDKLRLWPDGGQALGYKPGQRLVSGICRNCSSTLTLVLDGASELVRKLARPGHRIPQHVTREDILAAIAECDELGLAPFLARHGYKLANRWQLRVGGRSYPSKAILGVAAGLTARQFSGGASHTVRVLTRLGFQVRDGRQGAVPAAVAELVDAESGAFPFKPWTGGNTDPVAYFASGLNTAANIAAFGAIGHDVGVAFPELREAGIQALFDLADTDVQVFVDSGAFSEVEFDDDGPHIVKPLGDDHWRRYLATCRRLAVVLGDQLHIVAPDMVGNQATTLERLALYAPELRELDELGARVLVPVQKGVIAQAAFWAIEQEVLGAGNWIPTLPCMKAATSASEAASFAAIAKPAAMHLLGLGSRNHAAGKFLDGIEAASPGCLVSCDSCLLAATCGKTRRYGAARRRGFELAALGLLAADVATRTMFQVAMAFGAMAVGS